MKNLIAPLILSKRGLEHKTVYSKKKFDNTKCPYCNSNDVCLYGLKFDTAAYCIRCDVNWIEMSNGTIWLIPPLYNEHKVRGDCF